MINMTQATSLIYMQDSDKLQDTATILDVLQTESGKPILILDQTIFYPQGGGQPFDTGTIRNGSSEFIVDEVRFKDGLVYHIGEIKSGSFLKNDLVQLSIDEPRRQFNKRNHSAGHVIDVAVKNIGLHLVPVKGFHFPEGAYVEYQGLMEEEKKEELRVRIEVEANSIVSQKLSMISQMVTYDKLQTSCDFVPEYLPKDKPIRIEKIGNFSAHPCGGTHVSNTEKIGPISIVKIKSKSGNTRISYKIEAVT